MKIDGIELIQVKMPLRQPFRTSFDTVRERDLLLVRVASPDAEGWAECAAFGTPMYSSEYVAGALDVVERFLAPRLLERGDVRAEEVAELLAPVRGHRMAKSAVETALLDAQLRARGEPLAHYLGATRDRVPAGVSVGILDSVPELLDVVSGHLAEGYLRIKLKIEPGWDVEPVRAVRERFGDDLLLQVDANAAYTLADAPHLQRLDAFGLLLVEQPLGEEQLRQHAELARLLRTPICLDESIVSAESAADALALGACRIVNIKPGRVGGYLEARRVHDVCRAHGAAVWCGGMLETGIGRAANVALAGLPGFTVPGDTSASSRYYEHDLTEPFVLRDGHLDVPAEPGIGVTPDEAALAERTVEKTWVTA
ncbi:o-succinylbenzoate synthase [Amycolatopsis nivea]|uniref:o-succinylbenzoate synthase n=1 Tax=Amycolatopsis nivea TaxID=1644109 RepID=UPI0010700003|nr:o-succinylbenzoate synthase [Amycolatopsis nivea]